MCTSSRQDIGKKQTQINTKRSDISYFLYTRPKIISPLSRAEAQCQSLNPKRSASGELLTGARQYVCIPVCVCVISSLEPFYHCVAAFKNKRYDVHQSLTRLFHEKSFSPGPLKRFFFVPRCRQENAYKFFGGVSTPRPSGSLDPISNS